MKPNYEISRGLPNEPREESWLGFTLLKLPLDDLTKKHEREPQNHEREPQNHEARNEVAQVAPVGDTPLGCEVFDLLGQKSG